MCKNYADIKLAKHRNVRLYSEEKSAVGRSQFLDCFIYMIFHQQV